MNCIKMAIEKIQYWDNGRVAREKINNIMQEVEDNIPSIWENGDWYLWETDTWTPATWPQWPTWDDWFDILSPQEYEDKPWTWSDDVAYLIWK